MTSEHLNKLLMMMMVKFFGIFEIGASAYRMCQNV